MPPTPARRASSRVTTSGTKLRAMPTVPTPQCAKKHSGPRLPLAAFQRRLEDIELATVSVVRDLQMDVEGDPGVPSTTALRQARKAIR
jgi:hypothetical protein